MDKPVEGTEELKRLKTLIYLSELYLKNSSIQNIAKDIVIVSLQHIFLTTASMFRSIIELGFLPENTFLLGKLYSTNVHGERWIINAGITYFEFAGQNHNPIQTFDDKINIYVKKMWKAAQKKIQESNIKYLIILDEGGHCLENIPEAIVSSDINIVGIEQTKRGLYKTEKFSKKVPIISVASCAAKKHLESLIIVRSIYKKVKEIITPKEAKKSNIGIIGVGVIGEALLQYLQKLRKDAKKFNLFIYDTDQIKLQRIKTTNNKVYACDSVEQLVFHSDFIFGCTGKDISSIEWLDFNYNGSKTLISCSSSDIEFQKLVYKQDNNTERNIFDDVVLENTRNKGIVRILNGGYPINFMPNEIDIKTQDSVRDPREFIQITRGLLFSSIIYASEILCNYNLTNSKKNDEIKVIKLPHNHQKQVVSNWIKAYPRLRTRYDDIEHFLGFSANWHEWISENSEGQSIEDFYDYKDFLSLR